MSEPPREREMLVRTTDLVVALIILAIRGTLYCIATRFDEVANFLAQNIPPEFFPRLVITIIAILTLGVPFEHTPHARRSDS